MLLKNKSTLFLYSNYPFIAYFIITFIALFGLMLEPGAIAMQVDWSTPIYSDQYWYWFTGEFHAWSELTELGNRSGSSGIYGKFIFWLISLVFIDGMIMKIALFLMFFISAISAYTLGKKINLTKFSSFMVGVVYMSTPYMFDRASAGLVFMSLSYAILPILFISLLDVYKEMSLKRATFAGFIAGLVLTNAANVIILPILIVLVQILLYFEYKGHFIRASLLSLYVIIIMIIMHLHWIIPMFVQLLGANSESYISSQLSNVLVTHHVNKISIFDALKLDTFHIPFFTQEHSFIAWKIFCYSYLMMLVYVVTKPYSNYVSLFLILYIVGVLLSSITSGLSSSIFIFFLEKIPALSVLRDMGKFTLISSLSISIIVGAFINSITQKEQP
jgi:hypothetical protein